MNKLMQLCKFCNVRLQHKSIAGYTFTAALFFATDVFAQFEPEGLSVGIVVMTDNGWVAGTDTTTSLLPTLRYNSRNVTVGLPDGVRVTAYEADDLRVSTLLSPRFSDIEDADSPLLQGLDRQLTGDFGVLMEYETKNDIEISVSVKSEITGEHGGQEFAFDAEYGVFFLGPPIFISAGLSWQSSDLAAFQYGIRPEEASGTNVSYQPGEVVVPRFGARLVLPVSEHIRILANLEAELLPDEITDSPAIEEDMKLSALFGVLYAF